MCFLSFNGFCNIDIIEFDLMVVNGFEKIFYFCDYVVCNLGFEEVN